MFREVSNTARATLSYLDQPHVVHALQKASWPVGIAASGVLGAEAVQQEHSLSDKRKESIKQALVLGTAVAGTAWAAKKWFYEPSSLKTLSQPVITELRQLFGEEMGRIASKSKRSIKELRQVLLTVQNTKGVPAGKKSEALAHLLPSPELEDNPMHEVKNFLKLGAAAVGSGLLGGAIANKLTNQKGHLPAQLKEGLFQLGVNIGMCGVGAAAGIKAAESFGHSAHRLKRMGWITAGLAAGIAGGNLVSAALEKAVVKPLAQATGNTKMANETPRQVGVMDLMMHVDDLPLMLMFAGVEAVKPVIPLCFLYSALKTGLVEAKGGGNMLPVKSPAHATQQTFSGVSALKDNRFAPHPAFQHFNAAV